MAAPAVALCLPRPMSAVGCRLSIDVPRGATMAPAVGCRFARLVVCGARARARERKPSLEPDILTVGGVVGGLKGMGFGALCASALAGILVAE